MYYHYGKWKFWDYNLPLFRGCPLSEVKNIMYTQSSTVLSPQGYVHPTDQPVRSFNGSHKTHIRSWSGQVQRKYLQLCIRTESEGMKKKSTHLDTLWLEKRICLYKQIK